MEQKDNFKNGGVVWLKICAAFRENDDKKAHELISSLLTEAIKEERERLESTDYMIELSKVKIEYGELKERERITKAIENEMPTAWFPESALHLKKKFMETVLSVINNNK